MPLEQCLPIYKKLEVSFKQASQLIKSRRSIREFRDKPVSRELITQIIDVARYAPTGHNMQEVQWLVIDNPEELKKLTAIGVDWFRSMAKGKTPWALEMQAIVRMHDLGINIFLRDAPAVVVAFAEKNNLMAATDCAIALSYFDLAAMTAGLGCCWNGYFYVAAQHFTPMIKAVALPEGFVPYVALNVGYPMYRYQRIPVRRPARIIYHS
jgi:nitroreductase